MFEQLLPQLVVLWEWGVQDVEEVSRWEVGLKA